MIANLGLLTLLGVAIAYPLYFLRLTDFRRALIEDHPELWNAMKADLGAADMQVTYQALKTSRGGMLRGLRLSEAADLCRRRALRALYAALALFMVLLALGLFEALSSGKY